MPGTLDNPVVLDPFRTIVEVGWPNERFIAVRLNVRGETTFLNDTEYCDPPTIGPDAPGYHYVWLESVLYEVGIPELLTYYVSRDGVNWVAPSQSVSLEGLPESPSAFTHSAWEHVWLEQPGTNGTFVGNNGTADPDTGCGWEPEEGTLTEYRIPSSVDFFETGFIPTFGYFTGPYLSSAAVCYTDGFLQSTTRNYDQDVQHIDTFDFPLDSIVATYKGRTFRGMAAKVTQQEVSMGGPLNDFTKGQFCWILLEREDPTP